MNENWINIIVSMFSSIPVGCLAAWLGKVWANRISYRESKKNEAEIEKLKTKLQVRQNVFKIQFEKEFEIYQTLCTINASIRSSLAQLTCLKIGTKEENEVRKQALNNLNAFIKVVNSQEAFMSEEVYRHCSILLSMICTLDNEHDEAFYRELEKETKQLFKVIRTRLNNLNALE